MAIRLGDDAPDFTADSTEGPISFHDWKGDSWAVLFSHPKDFTPVCTTELGRVAALKPEFDKRNTKVIGLSVDGVSDHEKWSQDITDVTGSSLNFPLLADPDKKVADLYDMIHPNASDTTTVRSVFVIGADNKVKLTLTYPASTGRNFDELLRVIDSLQLTAKHKVATPADWKNGEDVIIVPAVSDEDAKVAFPDGWDAKKPYLRVVKQPELTSSLRGDAHGEGVGLAPARLRESELGETALRLGHARRGVGLPPGRRRGRAGEADQGLRDAVLGGVGGGDHLIEGGGRGGAIATAGERQAARDPGRDPIQVAGAVMRVDLVGLGQGLIDGAARGVREGERRLQVGVDLGQQPLLQVGEPGHRPVDVAGLQAMQRQGGRALGVADDDLVHVDRRSRERRQQLLAALRVAHLHRGAHARHRGHGPLALGRAPIPRAGPPR